MRLQLSQVVLPVSDIDRAADFYGSLLGIQGQRISGDRHLFDLEDVILTCCQIEEPHAASLSGTHQLCFTVENLEAVFETAKEAGCQRLEESIHVEPWGHRSFSARDPFGNSILFLSDSSLDHLRRELAAVGPQDRLRKGAEMSLSSATWNDDQQLSASVVSIFDHEIWLKLPQSVSGYSLNEGDGISIRFWDNHSAYRSDTKILAVSTGEEEHLAIAVPEQFTELEARQHPRTRLKASFAFSVLRGPTMHTPQDHLFPSKTSDICVGGLRFETAVPLQAGHQLQVHFPVSNSEKVGAALKVVSTRRFAQEGDTVNSVGAQFLGLPLEDQIKILEFLIDSEEPSEGSSAPKAESPDGPALPSSAVAPQPVSTEPTPYSLQSDATEEDQDVPHRAPEKELPDRAASGADVTDTAQPAKGRPNSSSSKSLEGFFRQALSTQHRKPGQ